MTSGHARLFRTSNWPSTVARSGSSFRMYPASSIDHRRATSFGGVGQIPLVARLGHAEGRCDGPVGVEENWEREAFPLDPVLVGLGITVIHSKDADVLVLEAGMVVTVPVTVAGSIPAAGRGEEPEPDLLSPKVRQPDIVAGVIDGCKVRRFIALF